MKTFLILFLFILLSCTSKNEATKTTVNLLDDNNLAQWDFILEDSLLSINDIWNVEDGVLKCSGAVNGYIFTKEDYSNYKLSFDWRWPQEAGNSGVLLHINGPNMIWPLCIEAQLKTENAGDFFMMGGSLIKEQTDKENRRVAKLNESNEKAAGEWNTYEIECKEDNIKVLINGVLQNEASQASLNKGKIGLQSEGKPIEFRKIIVEAL